MATTTWQRTRLRLQAPHGLLAVTAQEATIPMGESVVSDPCLLLFELAFVAASFLPQAAHPQKERHTPPEAGNELRSPTGTQQSLIEPTLVKLFRSRRISL